MDLHERYGYLSFDKIKSLPEAEKVGNVLSTISEERNKAITGLLGMFEQGSSSFDSETKFWGVKMVKSQRK